ncbi:MAG: FlgO family outer membrane protein [Candidatus Sericytochromatia bacterium]
MPKALAPRIWIICLLLALWPFQARAEDGSYGQITRTLVEQLPVSTEKPRLVVLDLVDLEGKESKLGAYLAEDLLPELFASRRFTLLERSLIQKLIKEQGFSQSALADPEQALALGRLSGAKWILTGRYSVLADKIEVHLRLLSTETGEILALAHTHLPKTDDIRQLLGEKTTATAVQETTIDLLKTLIQGMNWSPGQPGNPPPSQQAAQPAIRPLFYEDFSEFPPGTLLPAYGPSLVVRASQRYDMHVLTSEDPAATLLTRELNIPANFLLEIHAIDTLQDPQSISLSPLMLVLTDQQGKRVALAKDQHNFRFYTTTTGRPAPWRYQEWNILALVKQGDSFRSYVNGQLINEIQLPGFAGFSRLQLYAPQLRNWAFTRLALYGL